MGIRALAIRPWGHASCPLPQPGRAPVLAPWRLRPTPAVGTDAPAYGDGRTSEAAFAQSPARSAHSVFTVSAAAARPRPRRDGPGVRARSDTDSGSSSPECLGDSLETHGPGPWRGIEGTDTVEVRPEAPGAAPGLPSKGNQRPPCEPHCFLRARSSLRWLRRNSRPST